MNTNAWDKMTKQEQAQCIEERYTAKSISLLEKALSDIMDTIKPDSIFTIEEIKYKLKREVRERKLSVLHRITKDKWKLDPMPDKFVDEFVEAFLALCSINKKTDTNIN